MTDRTWVHEAIARIEADFARSADTHLIRVELPAHPGIDLYLKDESTHPTGSLKHRLARSLFLYGLCNGWIGPGTTMVESSSGSTAVSEAYFARLLGLPFVAVMPATTSPDKIAQDRVPGRALPFRRPTRARSMPPAASSRPRRAATISTSSPMPSGRRTGAATTTSPNRSSARCGWSAPGAALGGVRRRHRRDLGHDRALHPLPAAGHAAVRGRPGALGVPPPLGRPERDHGRGAVLLHRGHRPAAGRALVQPRPGRPDDRGAGRGEPRRHARPGRAAGPALRRLDRHQSVGLRGADRARCGRAARPARSSRSCATRASAISRASSTMAGSGSAGWSWGRAASGSRRSSSAASPWARAAQLRWADGRAMSPILRPELAVVAR